MTLSKIEQKKNEQRERDNKRKREWRARKKLADETKKRLISSYDASQVQPSSIMRLKEGMTEKEADAKKKLKVIIEKDLREDMREKPRKKRLRFRLHHRKAKKIYSEIVPEAHPPKDTVDVIEEQIEKPMTTIHCPESIKEDGLREVKSNPENYIEINMVTKSRVIDSFYIPSDKKKFHYKEKIYDIDEEAIYLLPTKAGYFVPSSYYKEGIPAPKGFKNTNKGITGKAFSLLYMEQLYTSLLYTDETKYNLFIVILSIALLIIFTAGLYLTVFYNGGVFPHPIVPMSPLSGG